MKPIPVSAPPQRGGRPVHREHADDPGADADEGEDAVTRRSAAQVPLKPKRISERGGNQEVHGVRGGGRHLTAPPPDTRRRS